MLVKVLATQYNSIITLIRVMEPWSQIVYITDCIQFLKIPVFKTVSFVSLLFNSLQ